MAFTTLLYAVSDGIARITLNRPDKLNALNGVVIAELGDAIGHVEGDPGVRGVILTGAGPKAFVAGADISEIAEQGASEGKARALAGQLVFRRLERCGKPVIAAVNGFALGGGCELAMACHLRVASESAKFGQPEVKLGIGPGYGGTVRLPRLVGKGRALELLLTGQMIDAQEAWRTCLEAVDAGLEMSLDQALLLEANHFGLLSGTADLREGTRAFLEKRKPVFQGK
jgi:enoyl-CoA hydratase